MGSPERSPGSERPSAKLIFTVITMTNQPKSHSHRQKKREDDDLSVTTAATASPGVEEAAPEGVEGAGNVTFIDVTKKGSKDDGNGKQRRHDISVWNKFIVDYKVCRHLFSGTKEKS
jgi:hypothetical protein